MFICLCVCVFAWYLVLLCFDNESLEKNWNFILTHNRYTPRILILYMKYLMNMHITNHSPQITPLLHVTPKKYPFPMGIIREQSLQFASIFTRWIWIYNHCLIMAHISLGIEWEKSKTLLGNVMLAHYNWNECRTNRVGWLLLHPHGRIVFEPKSEMIVVWLDWSLSSIHRDTCPYCKHFWLHMWFWLLYEIGSWLIV